MTTIFSFRRAKRLSRAVQAIAFSSVLLLPISARPDPRVTVEGILSLPAPSEKADTTAPPDLNADTRLSVMATVEAKSKTLSDCLPLLAPANVTVRPAARIALRRVTVFAAKAPLRQLMSAFADVLDLSWRLGDSPSQEAATQKKNGINKNVRDESGLDETASSALPRDYTLFQSPEAQKRERKQIADSEAWNTRAHDAKRDAMAAAIRNALNPPADDKHAPDLIHDLLAALSPEQISQACELATQPLGVIAADNNRNLLQNLVGVRPFTDLPAVQQSQARALLGRPQSSSGGDDLSRSSVGFVAIEGAISLAIAAPDGSDVSFSSRNGVHSQTVPALASDDDSDPEINALARGVTLLDLRGVPKAIRDRRLRFGHELDHGCLPDLLQSLARQTGLAIVADDFVRSRRTVYYWLLTDKPDYTLDEACGQISKAFGHRMIYKDGVLRVQTVSPGPDLRAEPPPQVIARLRDMTEHHLPTTLDDYAMLGRLTRTQLSTLVLARFPGVERGMLLLNAQRAYSVLHFYALLPPDLRERATNPAGLPFSALNARQTEAFTALSQLGAMRAATGKTGARSTGLYVRVQEVTAKYSRGKALCWTFDVVPDKASGRVASYTLEP